MRRVQSLWRRLTEISWDQTLTLGVGRVYAHLSWQKTFEALPYSMKAAGAEDWKSGSPDA